MIVRFVLKDAHVPASIQETMNKRCHQRMDAYFKDEAGTCASFITKRTIMCSASFTTGLPLLVLGY